MFGLPGPKQQAANQIAVRQYWTNSVEAQSGPRDVQEGKVQVLRTV